MNNPNPNPFIPQGSLLERKNRLRSRVRTAFFCVVGIPAAAILVALLAQGCKREPAAPPVEPTPPSIEITNPPVMDTNPPPVMQTNPPPVVEPTSVAPAGVAEYTVVKGDTFSSIAKKRGVSIKAIQEANPGVDPKKLKIGQQLVIPAATVSAAVSNPTAALAGEQVYVVKSGDTLTRIATHFGTTAKAIRSANNLTTDKIKVGDKLKIPAKASAPASAPAPVPAPVTPAEPAPMTPMPAPPVTQPAR
jgi:LysM repeat protein